MSKDIDFAGHAVTGLATLVSGSAIGVDVLVTADELITERPRQFSRSMTLVTHYPLRTLSGMKVSRRSPTGGQCSGCWSHCATCIPHPIASCVQLEFAGMSPADLCLIFGQDAQVDFERIVSMLGARLVGTRAPLANRRVEAR